MISAWVDPYRTMLIRGHLGIDIRVPNQVKFFKHLLEEGMVQDGSPNREMCITADTQGVVRYGRSGESPYMYSDSSSGTGYRTYYAYDSKAKAMHALLTKISSHVPIAGMRLVTLSSIPDEVLLAVGYERIADELRRGPDMWLGNPEWVLTGNSADTGSYGNSTVRRANSLSFLEILGKHWLTAA